MNVFVDMHHGDLFYSLQLLFEKRLSWNLYRPIGMEWFYNGYWKIGDPYPAPYEIAAQYLSTADNRNLNGEYKIQDGIYHVHDSVHRIYQKAVTFEKFERMEMDIIISSYQPHDVTYAQLISKYKPKAKHIAQLGNAFQTTEVKNVMCSTAPYPALEDKNVVFYHQEFSLEAYNYTIPPHESSSKICSFVNLLPKRDLFELYRTNLSEFDWHAYGISCPDGTICQDKIIGELMSQSLFGYHVKPGGDGFGHVIHNWFACGRPVLVNGNDYRDKLAGQLLIDGETCIDLDKYSFADNVNRIKYWSVPENHIEMCANVYKKFKQLVDYDLEEKKIRKFLDCLI